MENFDFTSEESLALLKRKRSTTKVSKSTKSTPTKSPSSTKSTPKKEEHTKKRVKTETNTTPPNVDRVTKQVIKSEQPKASPKTPNRTPPKNERNSLSAVIQKNLDSFDIKNWHESKGYKLRENSRTLLIGAFCKKIPTEFSESVEEYTTLVNSIVWALESSIYDNYFVFTPKTYSQTVRSLVRHIPSNPIKFLTTDPTFTATMQVNEMVGDYQNRRVFVEPVKQTDIFGGKGENKCPKCRSINTNYTTAQLSKGDEATTVLKYCEDCGHKWK
jgi:DNA-directed RNA polymerase subunit M/transcription elongation factor TFIIS